MHYFRLVATMIWAGVAGLATAQKVSPLAQIMELNRSGQWEQAAESAQRYLDANAGKPPDERCQAYYSLIYAQTRLGRIAQAQTNLATYERKCKSIMPNYWLPREIAKLRAELAPKHAAPPIRKDGFWRTSQPATLAVNVSALENHRQLCERTGADACLVIRQGRIVQEIYSASYRVPMMAMSSTK